MNINTNEIDNKNLNLLRNMMLNHNDDKIVYDLKELFYGIKYGRINPLFNNAFTLSFKREDLDLIRREIIKIMRDEDTIDEDWAFPRLVEEAKRCRKQSINIIKNKIMEIVLNDNNIYIKFNTNSFIREYLYGGNILNAIKERNNILYEELMKKTWHPQRVKEWCLSIDELKDIDN